MGRNSYRKAADTVIKSDQVPPLRDKTEDSDIPVQPGKGTGRRRILIVEDNESMLHLLSKTLEVLNYDYVEAKDGREAVIFLSKEHFDLVISDIRMPGMSGLKLLQIVKEHIPGLPVILITGYRLSRPQEDALRMRADGYLPKPFALVDLKGEIDRVLGGEM